MKSITLFLYWRHTLNFLHSGFPQLPLDNPEKIIYSISVHLFPPLYQVHIKILYVIIYLTNSRINYFCLLYSFLVLLDAYSDILTGTPDQRKITSFHHVQIIFVTLKFCDINFSVLWSVSFIFDESLSVQPIITLITIYCRSSMVRGWSALNFL